jgi:hypothetical protein
MFQLADDEVDESNSHFEKYLRVVRMNKDKGDGVPGEKSSIMPWKHLTKATQHACHPAMVLIMHIARNPLVNDDD